MQHVFSVFFCSYSLACLILKEGLHVSKEKGDEKRKRGGLIHLSALCENRKPEVFSGYGSETLVKMG